MKTVGEFTRYLTRSRAVQVEGKVFDPATPLYQLPVDALCALISQKHGGKVQVHLLLNGRLLPPHHSVSCLTGPLRHRVLVQSGPNWLGSLVQGLVKAS